VPRGVVYLSCGGLTSLFTCSQGDADRAPLAPAKVLRTDAAVPTRRRSSRASRAAASTATAASRDSRGVAEVSEPQPAAATTEQQQVVAGAQQAPAAAEARQAAEA
jgi:hypothetical protein